MYVWKIFVIVGLFLEFVSIFWTAKRAFLPKADWYDEKAKSIDTKRKQERKTLLLLTLGFALQAIAVPFV